MNLAVWEDIVRVGGFVVLATAWVTAAVGTVSAGSRPAGRAVGLARRWRARPVYALGAVPYFIVCVLLWRPLPFTPPDATRITLLVAGAVFGVTGALAYLAGRKALGPMYNVSSSLGSELFADHRLVTTGAYSWCRHPMYLGLVLGAVGGLLVYRTWTLVFMIAALAGAGFKAGREEEILAAEFGPAWDRYASEVPRWIPRLDRRHRKEVNHGRTTAPAA